MSARAWTTFFVLICLSIAVAILGTPELGGIALIIAGAGAATAIFGAIQDHQEHR